jgi:acyl-CoA thioester hydrolase
MSTKSTASDDGMIEAYRGVVYPRHLDHMDHMNVQYYVEKFDEGVWHVFAAIGLTPTYMREQNRGMAAVEMNIRYLAELHAGDLIAVRAGIVKVGEKSLHVVQRMRNAETGETAAEWRAVAVHLDRKARRGILFPPEVAERARAMIVAPPGD